jgi:hypothetical protein
MSMATWHQKENNVEGANTHPLKNNILTGFSKGK